MSDRIRVGIIGAGGIVRSRHLPGLAKLDGVEVVTVCNRTVESSQRFASEFKIPEVSEDWRALVERTDLDAVLIGTWPYMHREMSEAVLKSGKHCFCQARMAKDLAEARSMAKVAAANPTLVNMICPPPTRMPFEPFIRKVLGEGQLGQVTLVELRSSNGANLSRERVTWRERRQFSGNQIMAMGIWAETLNAWVGPYVHLKADLATPIRHKRPAAGDEVVIDIPQVVTISGQLANGALAIEHHLGLAAHKSDEGDSITIFGLEGTMRFEFGGKGTRLLMAKAGEPLAPVDVPANLQRPWRVEADFIEAVRAARLGKSWSVSPDFLEGVGYMLKVEAVHNSAATGAAVRLAEL